MKLAILYHSESGHTKAAAAFVQEGMEQVENVTVQAIDIKDAVPEDMDGVCGVAIGAPTYYAQVSWQMLQFLETTKLPLADKLGCAFSTANVNQGGSELVLQNINTVMLAKGMTVYSGGTSHGKPFTHVGANAFAVDGGIEGHAEVLRALGKKFAEKAVQYFG
ncbi:MAG: hypothetical protein MJ116_08750 [Lachnospiraceae bacterium]|nr:hypothetical protein [Lachnospiraceae bacterium]